MSQSFSPWQFEVDPAQATINAVLDAVVTQVIAGVKLTDICLADNFYTPSKDKYAYWYLIEQVEKLAELSVEFGTPFITGKDSSSGSAVFDGQVINVVPSVCITAMGKIRDVRRLKPHQWQAAGNLIYVIGPQVTTISGSILSAALGMTGNRLNEIGYTYNKGRGYMQAISRLCCSELVRSAVPINRGGIILRLFEGVEASGFGFKAQYCQALFPESFGTVLVEVRPGDRARLEREYSSLEPRLIGRIVGEKGLTVQGRRLPWNKLFKAWDTRFEKEVYQ